MVNSKNEIEERRLMRRTTRKIRIEFLVGVYLLLGVILILASTERTQSDDSGGNFIALHDRNSSRYDKDCTECHADIFSEQSLNPNIAAAHKAMRPFVPGKNDNDRCAWCHKTVDLLQKSAGNIRRNVDVMLCAICHGPFDRSLQPRPKQFYEAGLDPSQPDGPALYGLLCESCHRPLENSKVRGESAREIQKKISENEGGMGPLFFLTSQEIQAIADALAKVEGDKED